MSKSLWRRCLCQLAPSLFGCRRKPLRRGPGSRLRLELLEDRLAPANVLHWVGADVFSPFSQGLQGQYFGPGAYDSPSVIQPAVASNASWQGNRTPTESIVLTGPIAFPDFNNNGAGFTDNNTDPAKGTQNTFYTTIGNTSHATARWFGNITIPNNGKLGNPITFSTSSDDGSVLYIDDMTVPVVNNNFYQGKTTRQTTVNLAPGVHKIDIEWYNGGGGGQHVRRLGHHGRPTPRQRAQQ